MRDALLPLASEPRANPARISSGQACRASKSRRATGDPFTYDLVGPIYERVEQSEAWCREAETLADIAVLTPKEFPGPRARRNTTTYPMRFSVPRFSSHRHAPSHGDVAYPGIVWRGNVIHFSHPLSATYHACAPLWRHKLLEAALRLLLPNPFVMVDAPSSTIVTLARQRAAQARPAPASLHPRAPQPRVRRDRRDHPATQSGGEGSAPRPVSAVTLVPQGGLLAFPQDSGTVQFVVPRVDGYQVIDIGYGGLSE